MGTTITDIKFDCAHCGQKMVVDCSAAGLSTECPYCNAAIVIPRQASIHDAAPMATRHGKTTGSSNGRGALAVVESDTELAALRQELTDASVQISRLEGELTEVAKLKSDKKRLRSELTQLKKDLLAKGADLNAALAAREEVEHRATALAAEINRIEGELSLEQERSIRLRDEIEALEAERATTLPRLEAAETELVALRESLTEQEREQADLRTTLIETQAARTTALREVQSLEERVAGLSAELSTTQATQAQTEARLKETAAALEETRQRLTESEASAKALTTSLDEMTRERDALSKSLSQDTAGKDLVVVREQLGGVTKERDRLGLEVERLNTDIDSVRVRQRKTEEDLKSTLRELDEARRRAEAASEHRLRQDNEVLRGIIARQNTELEQRHVQIVRLKRAQLAVRLAYAAFAIGLLLIAMWAVKTVPALRLGKLF